MKKFVCILTISIAFCFIFSACGNTNNTIESFESNDVTSVMSTSNNVDEFETTDDVSISEEPQAKMNFSEFYKGELTEFVDFIIPEGFDKVANGDKLEKYSLMTDIVDTIFFQNNGTDIIVKFNQNVIIEETETSYQSAVEEAVQTMKYIYPNAVINCGNYTNENGKLISTIMTDTEDIGYGFILCEIADSMLTISCNSSELDIDEIEDIVIEIGASIEEF